jgi:hypothetical protein
LNHSEAVIKISHIEINSNILIHMKHPHMATACNEIIKKKAVGCRLWNNITSREVPFHSNKGEITSYSNDYFTVHYIS